MREKERERERLGMIYFMEMAGAGELLGGEIMAETRTYNIELLFSNFYGTILIS